MRARRFWIVWVATLTLGCATSGGTAVVTASKRAEDAPPSPKRIYILTRSLDADGNPNLGLEFQKALEGRLSTGLARCGVVTTGRVLGRVELEDEVAKVVASFDPEAVLFLRRSHVLLYDQSVSRETYDVALVGEPRQGSKEAPTWWKAVATNTPGNMMFSGTGARSAEALVDQVLARMKLDGFYPGCAATSPGELPGALNKVPASSYVASTKLRITGAITLGEVIYPSARVNAAAQEKQEAVLRTFGTVVDQGTSDRPSAPLSAVVAESLAMPDQLRAPTARFGRNTYQPSLEVYVRTALSAELERMGVAVAGPPRTLRVQIEEASLDLSGWGYGASVRLKYEVTDAATGKVLHSSEWTVTTPAGKRAMSEREAWDHVLLAAVESLALDLEAARVL